MACNCSTADPGPAGVAGVEAAALEHDAAGPIAEPVEDEGVSRLRRVETVDRSPAAIATGSGAQGTPSRSSNLQHREERFYIHLSPVVDYCLRNAGLSRGAQKNCSKDLGCENQNSCVRYNSSNGKS